MKFTPIPERVAAGLMVFLLAGILGCSSTSQNSSSHEREIQEGRALYLANGCALCHGPEGHGDGPVAKTMHNSPRDFRDPAGFVNGYNVGPIAITIGTGLTQGNRSMPSYGHLSAAEREQLAEFVMSLASPQEKSNEHP